MNHMDITDLLQRFPRVTLCDYTTPLQRLHQTEKYIGFDGTLYMKRDDLNGVGPGGNKVRPLEFLLGEAISQGCDKIIASGPMASNLCIITAAACGKLNLSCALVYNGEEECHPNGNQRLTAMLPAQRVFVGEGVREERNQAVEQLAQSHRNQGGTPYVIENGGTGVTGALGYINLVLELHRQQSEHNITDLFVCGGNGGLATGIIFGNLLLDCPYHVHVISAEHETAQLQHIIQRLLRDMADRCEVGLPEEKNYTVYDQYRGAGWGYDTEESIQMSKEFAKMEGIFLDSIYNAKTVVGALDILRGEKGRISAACLIHSGGFSSIF